MAEKKTTEKKAATPRRPRRRTNYPAAADRSAPVVKVDPTAAPQARAPRTKPVRVTLDLPTPQHKALKRWCSQAALDADLTSVTLASVLRILGDLLVTDDDLAEQVKARLLTDADNT